MNAVATLFGSEETRSQVSRWRTELIDQATQAEQQHRAAAAPDSASAASAAARNRRTTAAIIRQMAG